MRLPSEGSPRFSASLPLFFFETSALHIIQLNYLACLVVVFVVALLVSLLSQSPLIFLRLAELQNGEMDVTVSAGDWTGFYFMNYSQIEAQVI